MNTKKLLLALSISAISSTSAMASTLGVSMAYFDDNFLTIVRNNMSEEAKKQGTEINFEDAQGDIGRQVSQIQNFIASGVDAIVVNPVDSAATGKMIKLATEAKIPLVFVNRKPDSDKLPEGVAFVGSNELDSGTLEMQELARLAGEKGNVAIMVGELGTNAAQLRTKDVEDVVAKHPDMKIVEKQVANWSRNEAIDLMTNWLTNGTKIDVIAANNDEMAIGAIMALQQAGVDPKPYFIGGVDATPDALTEIEKGNLDVTVFQDAAGQGAGSVDVALKMAKGEKVEQWNWIPFQLVTPENYKQFMKN
ncbi:sugar ABC transporter substrate-binding protein [Pokkaliibacter sp. MBI-7]|uniref:sugar ABC transporter substrate-binding protein n=1 Tax=Pokkaliibacter sp. MBI-7 TaxID=3040600 RepID=UPI00244982A8|nr:sugar ABC transporter substrate-binding protein [Pokkaliibacter sp. MBI-7]MDH2434386.1 sugar ABC transporter substrate-binding protein [Pokkaliibacter sp. MBI-7]